MTSVKRLTEVILYFGYDLRSIRSVFLVYIMTPNLSTVAILSP